MKAEKVILSFVAVFVGLVAAGVAFYFYQTTKVIKDEGATTDSLSTTPKPSPKPSLFVTLDSPKNEEVTDKKTIAVMGTTVKNAVVIVTTATNDYVLTPTTNGKFSTTIVLEGGQNEITIVAVAPNGEEEKIIRTVTVSSETF